MRGLRHGLQRMLNFFNEGAEIGVCGHSVAHLFDGVQYGGVVSAAYKQTDAAGRQFG